MTQSPTLVILAAGMGSRYGGMKQLEPVGPGGATLMEYSIWDAMRAGFSYVVFVVREEMEDVFAEFAAQRFGRRIGWALALQRLEDVPAETGVPEQRMKPWGTGHALLVAAPFVSGSFAVLNADDFYGPRAFAALGEFFGASPTPGPPAWAIVGYRLAETLSEAGPVNRGACRVGPEGWLERIEEVRGLVRTPQGRYAGQGIDGTVELEGDSLISMNLWGFTADIFPMLEQGFRRFLSDPDLDDREFLLPTVVQDAVSRGAARVRVLDPESPWFGMTHPADRPGVEAALRGLTEAGEYPEELWD